MYGALMSQTVVNNTIGVTSNSNGDNYKYMDYLEHDTLVE